MRPSRRRRPFAFAAALLALGLVVAGVLLFDFLFGAAFLSVPVVHPIRIEDPVYHHGLRPNGDYLDLWGSDRYRLCTDANGFRAPCGRTDTSRSFDIGIIGDSFVEGVGLPYEKTFVGRIAADHPGLRIANLGVTSYSPTVYLAKVRYLLSQGYSFSEIVVYVDVSDIQDEAIMYYEQDGVVRSPIGLGDSRGPGAAAVAGPGAHPESATGARPEPAAARSAARWLRDFPLCHTIASRLYHRLYPIPILAPSPWTPLDRRYVRSAWTYDPGSPGYGVMGVEGAKSKAVEAMSRLHTLLASRGIALSVAIYPWPAQLLYDREDSDQVKLWKGFCAARCRTFVNSFPAFFQSVARIGAERTIDAYYVQGDMHFNEAGNRLIADSFAAARAQLRDDAVPPPHAP